MPQMFPIFWLMVAVVCLFTLLMIMTILHYDLSGSKVESEVVVPSSDSLFLGKIGDLPHNSQAPFLGVSTRVS
uniref:ATP synthase F0 subunit 8 n=1 Tax=Bovicola bovis TaxID=160097 RepID=A0A386B277_9NEOP|nr:ATP synthase F0 subunit 8 [Bovicola bovis]